MQNIYETFEFNKIKEHLLEYAKTELAKVYIDELVMFDNPESVKTALEDLKEISSIIVRFGPFPIHSSANALVLIDLAKKTGLLTPRDLHLIAEDVLTIVKISAFIKKIEVNYPRVTELTTGFPGPLASRQQITGLVSSIMHESIPIINLLLHGCKKTLIHIICVRRIS